MIRASVRSFHSPDIDDLDAYVPVDSENFSFLLQIFIGPRGGEGEESFDTVVCTPRALEERCEAEGVVFGRHLTIVKRYDFSRLRRAIEDYVEKCEAASWSELAVKLGRIGKWEFEDYDGSTP